jgi:hypothetical protein
VAVGYNVIGGRLEALRQEGDDEPAELSCGGTDASQVRALCGIRRDEGLRSVVSALGSTTFYEPKSFQEMLHAF